MTITRGGAEISPSDERTRELARLIAEQERDARSNFQPLEQGVLFSLNSRDFDPGGEVSRPTKKGTGCLVHGNENIYISPGRKEWSCRICRRDRERIRYQTDKVWRTKRNQARVDKEASDPEYKERRLARKRVAKKKWDTMMKAMTEEGRSTSAR